ncbi:MAG: hypothetical protein F2916_01160 [Actinobacteria bacterium]|jgi:hypothetical protein|nr:hypothetical protein [Actinomycetota bacterium]MSZ60034.1 hypothetical protein [Actinomycetota bacterium]MSZ80078.1 hypothetical protein [Actinomycetota bacterium]MTB11724.1 hypothetical protein [Actinomycetota bacterium]
MARVTEAKYQRFTDVRMLGQPICTMGVSGGTEQSEFPFDTERSTTMIDTHDTVITEALAVIDKALAEMLRRELVSSVEVGDLLLDLRGLLTASVATTVAAV